MILFGSTLSPFVRKVAAFAAEKGLELETVPTGVGDPNPDFRAASPFGKMPALKDGDFSLSDSSAIVHYLEASHPDPNLIPTDPPARGRTVWFDEYADTLLFGCGAKIFFNRVVAPRFLGRDGDLELAEQAEREELPRMLDYLEGTIPDSGFLVEDRITLADIAVAAPFANLKLLGIEVDGGRFPRTRDYAEAMLARASFAPRLKRDLAFMAKIAG